MLVAHAPSGQPAPAATQWHASSLPSPQPPPRRRRQKIQVEWMYDADGNLNKDHLIEGYAPLVKRIAYQLMARLPASVDVDDLIQNGLMGLLDAINRFTDDQGAQFETYAVQRIRGAMLDGLRDNDWVPRSLRRDMRRIEEAMSTLEQVLGRAPNENELAEALEISLPEYQRMLGEARGHQLLYLEDFGGADEDDFLERHLGVDEANPARLCEDASMRVALVGAIDELPEREKLVMALYYDEELNLREIGEVLGVTESRVCQLHSQAVSRLRVTMGLSEPKPKARRGRPPKRKLADA